MMQKNLLAAAAALTLLLQGCATLVGDETQMVPISSAPPGATVTITDESGRVVYRGTTPASVEMSKSTGKYWGGKRFKVTIAKYGYSSQQFTLNTSPNGWYLVGNFLVSGGIGWFLVDPFGGKMYSLSPEGIDANLGRIMAEPRPADKPQAAAPLPAPAGSASTKPATSTPAAAPRATTPAAATTASPAATEAESPPSVERGIAVGVGIGVAVGVVAGPPVGIAAGLATGAAAANGTPPAEGPAAPAASPAVAAASAPPGAPAAGPTAASSATPAAAVPVAASPAAGPANGDGAVRRKKDVETAIEAAPQGDFGASEAIRRYAPAPTPAPAPAPASDSAPPPAVAPPPPPFRL
jgi:hypothetical protein